MGNCIAATSSIHVPDLEILDDVHLPRSVSFVKRVSNLFDLQIETNREVIKFLSTVTFAEVEDKPKEDTKEILRYQQMIINNNIKEDINDPPPVPGYLYFGNKNFAKQLGLLCQVNPFFASALTVAYGTDGTTTYLELKAYDENEKNPAKYLEFTRLLSDPCHRINVRFNMDMTINKITNYANGKEEIVEEKDYNYYASGAIYNVIYYSSAWHATIHVLQYLMTTCIVQSCQHDKGLSAWAEPYDDNIPIKYVEVALLLVQSSLDSKEDKAKIITGVNGFGSTLDTKPLLKKILCTWGTCKTAQDYMESFLVCDIIKTATKFDATEIMKQAGILAEFNKHIDNVKPFAEELSGAMKKSNANAFEKTEKNIKDFMSETGPDVSSIDTVSSWVQLMTCTGITHGSTLSYTRLLAVPEIVRWRNISSDKFDGDDIGLMKVGLGTIAGMTIDRHCFTDQMTHGKKWNTKNVLKEVMLVLQKYNSKATELKKNYESDLVKDTDLREYGFILTDHCSDGYDGKQHTITTYI